MMRSTLSGVKKSKARDMKRKDDDGDIELGGDESRVIYWQEAFDAMTKWIEETFQENNMFENMPIKENNYVFQVRFCGDLFLPSKVIEPRLSPSKKKAMFAMGIGAWKQFLLCSIKFMQDLARNLRKLDAFKDMKWVVYWKRQYIASTSIEFQFRIPE